jgi:uncharacterized protein (TIGR02231 family)
MSSFLEIGIKMSLFTILAALLVPMAAWAATIENKGKADSVTVYVNRAAVKRIVDVEYTAGAQTLVVEELPAGVEDNSIRVSAKGSAGLVIQNVDISSKELLSQGDPKVKAVISAIEAEQEKARLLDVKREARQAQVEFLKTLAHARAQGSGDDLTAKNPVSKPTPQELAGMLDMVFEKRMAAEKDMAGIEREKRKINEEINRLQRELAKLQGYGGASSKKAAVSFTADGPGKARFTLEYMLPGAWWSPVYVVRGDAEKKTVAVSYGAQIQQRTGEDWADVKIQLSTAQPSAGAKAPKVDPWWVGVREPVVVYAQQDVARAPMKKAKMAGAVMPASAPVEAMADKMETLDEAKQAVASVQSSGAVVNFDIPQRTSVPSGGDMKKVSVAELSFASELSYVSAPALMENVFIRASSLNSSAFPLLPGEANVFQGESFVGKSALEMVAVRQRLELELGVDPGFKVIRKLIKREAGTEGLLSSKSSVKFVYETEIHSFKKGRETVEVKDRLPFSRDARLVISGVTLDPKPEKKDEQNIVTWRMELRPGEKRKIRMEFMLTYPPELLPSGF